MAKAATSQELDAGRKRFHIVRSDHHNNTQILAGVQQIFYRIEHCCRGDISICIMAMPIVHFWQPVMTDADLHARPSHDLLCRSVIMHSIRCDMRLKAYAM